MFQCSNEFLEEPSTVGVAQSERGFKLDLFRPPMGGHPCVIKHILYFGPSLVLIYTAKDTGWYESKCYQGVIFRNYSDSCITLQGNKYTNILAMFCYPPGTARRGLATPHSLVPLQVSSQVPAFLGSFSQPSCFYTCIACCVGVQDGFLYRSL